MKKNIDRVKIIKLSIFIVFIIFLELLPNKSMRMVYSVNHDKYIENPHLLRKDAKDSLVIGVDSLNMNLNPFYDKKKDVGIISRLLNPSLVYRKEDGSWDLDLASDYWYEDEGKTIVFQLRPAYFKDGTRLTSEDVVTTYQVLADPKYDGAHVDYVEKIRGAYSYSSGQGPYDLGVVAYGEDLVKFHFNFYDPNNMVYLDFPIVNSKKLSYRYNDLSQVRAFEATDGAGDFELEKVGDDNSISLVKKDKEANEELSFDRLVFKSGLYFKIIDDYQKGQIDLVYKYNKNSDLMALIGDRTMDYTRAYENQQGTYSFIGFNMNQSIFKDEDLRRAFAASLDLDRYNNIYYGRGNYKVATNPIYSNSYFYREVKPDQPEKSLGQLMKERNLEPRLRMISSKNNDYLKTIGNYIVEDLAQEGLDLEIDYLQEAELFDRVYSKGDYDLFVYQRYMFEIPSLSNQFIFDINDGLNLSADPNWEVIENLRRLSYFIDLEDRRDLVFDWQDYFARKIPYIIINTPLEISLINDRIEGIEINEFGGIENTEKLKNIKIVLN